MLLHMTATVLRFAFSITKHSRPVCVDNILVVHEFKVYNGCVLMLQDNIVKVELI